MHSPSSTSSSERARRNRAWRTALSMAVTVTLLAVLNGGLHAALLTYWPDSRISEMVRYLRAETRQATATPSVLFLGNSRFRSAIVPEVFEAHLQSGPPVRFINCAQPSMSYWEFSKVFDHLDAKRLNVRACVIEVDPWTFSRYECHAITKEPVRHRREIETWGTAREILAVEGTLLKTRLLVQRYLPRHSVSQYIRAAEHLAKGPSETAGTLPRPPYHADRTLEHKLRDNPNFFAENISQYHMTNYTFSTTKANEFSRFLRTLTGQGITVLLVHPPVRKAYFNYVLTDPNRRKEFDKHLSFLDKLGAEYDFVNWQTPAEGGMSDDVFVDYGHLSLEGANIYSNALAQTLAPPLRKALAPAKPGN